MLELLSFMFPFGVYCLNVIGRETRDIYIGLDSNGNFADNTTTLLCSDELKIVLLQYRFLLLECSSLDQCQTISMSPLLPEEELVLHRKCSLQTRCENLKFPLRPETKTANAMHIKYECIAGTSMYDICGKFTKPVTEIAYLMYGTNGVFEECQCFVNRGKFIMILSDVRLTERTKDHCSPAELHINQRIIACDQTKNGFGSVFNDYSQEIIENAFISIIPHTDSKFPENILVTIKPENFIELTCEAEGPLQENLTLSSAEKSGTPTSTFPTATSDIMERRDEQSIPISSSLHIYLILGLGFCLLISILSFALQQQMWTYERKRMYNDICKKLYFGGVTPKQSYQVNKNVEDAVLSAQKGVVLDEMHDPKTSYREQSTSIQEFCVLNDERTSKCLAEGNEIKSLSLSPLENDIQKVNVKDNFIELNNVGNILNITHEEEENHLECSCKNEETITQINRGHNTFDHDNSKKTKSVLKKRLKMFFTFAKIQNTKTESLELEESKTLIPLKEDHCQLIKGSNVMKKSTEDLETVIQIADTVELENRKSKEQTVKNVEEEFECAKSSSRVTDETELEGNKSYKLHPIPLADLISPSKIMADQEQKVVKAKDKSVYAKQICSVTVHQNLEEKITPVLQQKPSIDQNSKHNATDFSKSDDMDNSIQNTELLENTEQQHSVVHTLARFHAAEEQMSSVSSTTKNVMKDDITICEHTVPNETETEISSSTLRKALKKFFRL